MITAIVFVHVENDRIPEVAEQIAAIDGISEVYSVTGRIDLIAIVRVPSFDDVAPVVSDSLAKVPGVRETETHLAFRAYSQRDLDATFSIGVGD
ncbi:Lrp/AsnC ligand binding domain-containing protein [Propionimicrobium sp. PCR01-08-3]|uniref:Lrp/AsnC family transcriptional regulator n=1 Tax=Propionimicrobium sp. PCR01-08-3 TaxID=3052086 RepID=UPI00255D125A|nr:Lrp/AsnC ligand binding domain-containing protein [Propionimicrobium sp. PCR01-08-3]WIY81679.1 Lrp/AsnC ligand binding domain-containing protein [Propionimicrobium sp. PCR01-08-3]